MLSFRPYRNLSTHDLTQRSTKGLVFYPSGRFFQLTTSRRGRLVVLCCTPACSPLSTHDLTQRSTFISIIFGEVQNLSTHDLTQRSTVLWIFWHHLQIFQLTTSRRGRQPLYIRIDGSSFLSTHDLTQRSTVPRSSFSCKMVLSTHDLTQRSTLKSQTLTLKCLPFNSRPHAEVDTGISDAWIMEVLSTHDLTQRSTHFSVGFMLVDVSFNSRPHAEVDQNRYVF